MAGKRKLQFHGCELHILRCGVFFFQTLCHNNRYFTAASLEVETGKQFDVNHEEEAKYFLCRRPILLRNTPSRLYLLPRLIGGFVMLHMCFAVCFDVKRHKREIGRGTDPSRADKSRWLFTDFQPINTHVKYSECEAVLLQFAWGTDAPHGELQTPWSPPPRHLHVALETVTVVGYVTFNHQKGRPFIGSVVASR
ncbi:hypothetical protein F2P81_024336 [Scophthalmus maximus]|uniref:Uncharacterized protein n=1 Tax=Scophthalmus maximus TaxID=52904 RepID=A0A6A4RMG1_SCOMX|nr:hypothetical protein F2P81_024336 [Scophthalmus maximus]